VGLGLAICRKLVEMHGGRLTARAAAGKGTVMSIWLPLQVAPADAMTVA
jgi:signal transduction histidine kinase